NYWAPVLRTRDFCGLGNWRGVARNAPGEPRSGSHRCWFRRCSIPFRTRGIPPRRQIRIEKTQSVGRFDDPHAFPLLLLNNLLVKLLHPGPMQLGTKMVLGVVPVVEPEQVVPFVVGTHSPGDRLIGVAAVVKEKAVQVRAAMSQIIKRKKENPELPVQHEADGDCHSKDYDL